MSTKKQQKDSRGSGWIIYIVLGVGGEWEKVLQFLIFFSCLIFIFSVSYAARELAFTAPPKLLHSPKAKLLALPTTIPHKYLDISRSITSSLGLEHYIPLRIVSKPNNQIINQRWLREAKGNVWAPTLSGIVQYTCFVYIRDKYMVQPFYSYMTCTVKPLTTLWEWTYLYNFPSEGAEPRIPHSISPRCSPLCPLPLASFCLGDLVLSLQRLDSVRVIYWLS